MGVCIDNNVPLITHVAGVCGGATLCSVMSSSSESVNRCELWPRGIIFETLQQAVHARNTELLRDIQQFSTSATHVLAATTAAQQRIRGMKVVAVYTP